MHRYGWSLLIAFLAVLGLTGCDSINPDMGRRDSISDTVIQAARDGDMDELLGLSSVEMQDRESAANALITMASGLRPGYTLEYQEPRGSPDYCIVTATDDQGARIAFDLSWRQSKWHLVLGTAGAPKSPTAEPSP